MSVSVQSDPARIVYTIIQKKVFVFVILQICPSKHHFKCSRALYDLIWYVSDVLILIEPMMCREEWIDLGAIFCPNWLPISCQLTCSGYLYLITTFGGEKFVPIFWGEKMSFSNSYGCWFVCVHVCERMWKVLEHERWHTTEKQI